MSLLTGFLVLIRKCPYGGNVVHISQSAVRITTSGLFSAFTYETSSTVSDDLRHTIGIVTMAVGIAYSCALFLLLVIKSGSTFIEWRARRRERTRNVETTPVEYPGPASPSFEYYGKGTYYYHG